MKKLAIVLLGTAAALLSVGFSACTNTSTPSVSQANQDSEQPSKPSVTEVQSPMSSPPSSSMPGMDHGSMNHGSMSMNLGPKDESFDLRFIDGMIPHHQGAVEMAQEALQKSKRPEIKQLAEAIVAAQNQEISQMQEWRTDWYPNAGDTAMMYDTSMGHMMPMTPEMRSSMMMSGDLGEADDQFDLRFINAMIPHHQGALDMANQALKNSERPEIQKLAQAILTSQQAEITEMEQWRKQWYGQ